MLHPLRMNRRDLALFILSTLVFIMVGVRLLLPTSETRRISVEAIKIESAPIKSGQTLDQQTSWEPPDDVFIVGWAPSLGSPGASPELHLVSGNTTIFSSPPASLENLKPTFLPSGTGFLVRKGEPLRLQLLMKNSGPDGETKGARALVYFHPVAWR